MPSQETSPQKPVTLEFFLQLAKRDDWTTFDATVLQICNDTTWLRWTMEGFQNSDIDVRDLAISISEKTTQSLTPEHSQELERIMATDDSLHLRRKSAIALFRKGSRAEAVIQQLKEAKENDLELRAEVTELLQSIS